MENTIKKIIAYFEKNVEIFNDCIEALDRYNGYLCDDRYYNMDELNELMQGKDATDLLNMAFFGYDETNGHTDASGQKIYVAFNPNRKFFTFNGYGNLVSSDYKDYSYKLDEYFINDLLEHRAYICGTEIDEELTALFDELENDNEEDGEQ